MSRPSRSLIDLPNEILESILEYLPYSSAVALSHTSRRFIHVCQSPSLWKHYCQRDFRYWDSRHLHRRKVEDPEFLDWKDLFAQRIQCSRLVKDTIAQVIADGVGRIARVQKIIDLRYDAKDALLELFKSSPNSEVPLAQR